MHLGKPLRLSLQEIKQDLLFWQREVYEKIDHQAHGKGKGLGQLPMALKGFYPHKGSYQKSSGKGKTFRQYTPFKGQDKGKGKKGKHFKGKKGDKGKGQWPSNWAKETPRGVQYCMNYHLKGSCSNSPCSRSHNCPVMKDTGGTWWTCNAPPDQHSAKNCPHA